MPKKSNPKSCNGYNLISFRRNSLEILLKTIQSRIQLDQSKFGFRNGVGAREIVFTMKVLLQESRKYNMILDIGFHHVSPVFSTLASLIHCVPFIRSSVQCAFSLSMFLFPVRSLQLTIFLLQRLFVHLKGILNCGREPSMRRWFGKKEKFELWIYRCML